MKNKVIVITGASSKIGSKMALELAKKGYDLVLHYFRNETLITQLENELTEIKANYKKFKADLTKSVEFDEFVEFSKKAFGKINCLINNAAYFPEADSIKGNFDLLSETEFNWEKTMSLNVKVPFFLTQAFADSLIENNGVIINMLDSCINKQPILGRASYSISKSSLAAVTNLTEQTFKGKIRAHGLILPFVIPSKSLENSAQSWVGVERVFSKVIEILEKPNRETLIRI